MQQQESRGVSFTFLLHEISCGIYGNVKDDFLAISRRSFVAMGHVNGNVYKQTWGMSLTFISTRIKIKKKKYNIIHINTDMNVQKTQKVSITSVSVDMKIFARQFYELLAQNLWESHRNKIKRHASDLFLYVYTLLLSSCNACAMIIISHTPGLSIQRLNSQVLPVSVKQRHLSFGLPSNVVRSRAVV